MRGNFAKQDIKELLQLVVGQTHVSIGIKAPVCMYVCIRQNSHAYIYIHKHLYYIFIFDKTVFDQGRILIRNSHE
jgi:hypothetical protein